MKKVTTLVAFATLALAGLAHADVLWDQSDVDPFGAGTFDSISGSPPFGLTVYAVSDITVDGISWNIDTITTWYSFIDGGWGLGIVQGAVSVFPKTGPFPVDGTDDPTLSAIVPMSCVMEGSTWKLTASGLGLSLPAGDYWIGITPEASSGPFGPEIHMGSATHIGDDTAAFDPFSFIGGPGWFSPGAGLDASILIEGTRPVPVDDATWAGVKALYR
ncbi:hypothetical protein K8I85_15865 [bacterium]|nr:hypothetical protein [bacterium]